MISGKPVKAEIPRTGIPACSKAAAVPPVDTSSTSSSASPRAKSIRPVLSDTDSSARRMRTSPGCVTRGTLTIDDDSARQRRVPPDRAGGDPAHRLAQQLVLERPQGGVDLVARLGAGKLDGALEDDRPGV